MSGASSRASPLSLRPALTFAQQMVESRDQLRTGPTDSFFDRAFAAEIDRAIVETRAAYTRCASPLTVFCWTSLSESSHSANYKEALKVREMLVYDAFAG